ncbi:hypothetical protein OG21DRAFT_321879 [Imleria badia]|nr:hypothetical protein OG21DRAFT_321879 [Imleria badia]
MKIPFLDTTVEVHTLYNLIGWIFFVSAGRIEKRATRDNYFLPLVCLYCLFCRRLSENLNLPAPVATPNHVAGLMDHDPWMLHIMWFNNPPDNKTYVCLSSSLDCATPASRAAYAPTKRKIQHQRGEQMKAIGIVGHDVDVDALPVHEGIRYGMCAETVPFLVVKSIMDKKSTIPFEVTSAEGFAIEGFRFLPNQIVGFPAAIDYDSDVVKESKPLREPCNTCRTVMERLRLRITNFRATF